MLDSLLKDIRIILDQARGKAYAAINFAMVESYWHIGKRIVDEEQQGKVRAEYGTELLKELSHQLSEEFGKGYSVQNLENFRKFYLTFPDGQKSYALRRELSWTHYRLIMRVENIAAREYYLSETEEQNWSTRTLERNINTLYYERLLSTKDKGAVLQKNKKMEKAVPANIIKDPYVLEFLNLPMPPGFSEAEFEQAIITNLQNFLQEFGKGFTFAGRQVRISTETKHFYIDLVFYNYILKCFVLVDLKLGELTHQDIGQMDMYLRVFEETVKDQGHNPTIGIILCAEKDEAIVKYSVMKENKKLFASKYQLILPTEKELKQELEREIQVLQSPIEKKTTHLRTLLSNIKTEELQEERNPENCKKIFEKVFLPLKKGIEKGISEIKEHFKEVNVSIGIGNKGLMNDKEAENYIEKLGECNEFRVEIELKKLKKLATIQAPTFYKNISITLYPDSYFIGTNRNFPDLMEYKMYHQLPTTIELKGIIEKSCETIIDEVIRHVEGV